MKPKKIKGDFPAGSPAEKANRKPKPKTDGKAKPKPKTKPYKKKYAKDKQKEYSNRESEDSPREFSKRSTKVSYRDKPKGHSKKNPREKLTEKPFGKKFSNKSTEPKRPTPKSIIQTEEMRLNKYMAHAGIASRRKADEIIAEGKVKVNGNVVVEMGFKVQPKDKVVYEGQVLDIEEKLYVLLNKPKDFITTTDDEKNRRTVMNLVKHAAKGARLYPVGRLDRNTTGLLLLTNDGELAQKLTHPSFEVKKTYLVVLNRDLEQVHFDAIKKGLTLEDGDVKVDDLAYPNKDDKREVGVEIHSGKNRIIRRLFEHFDYEVQKLDRVYYAGLTKKDLPRGKWRYLKEKELVMLRHFV